MCERCSSYSTTYDSSQNLYVLRTRDAVNNKPSFILSKTFTLSTGERESLFINVDYCPWCGEKLT